MSAPASGSSGAAYPCPVQADRIPAPREGGGRLRGNDGPHGACRNVLFRHCRASGSGAIEMFTSWAIFVKCRMGVSLPDSGAFGRSRLEESERAGDADGDAVAAEIMYRDAGSVVLDREAHVGCVSSIAHRAVKQSDAEPKAPINATPLKERVPSGMAANLGARAH